MVFVSYSMSTVFVILAVLQTAVTETIENQNGTKNYDPEKLIGTWYVMNMVGRDVFMLPKCVQMHVDKGENNVFFFSFGDSKPYHISERWVAKIKNSEIYKIPSNSITEDPDFSILDHPNDDEIVLQNRHTSVYLMMNKKRTEMSHELYEKYRKRVDDNFYMYRYVRQSDCE